MGSEDEGLVKMRLNGDDGGMGLGGIEGGRKVLQKRKCGGLARKGGCCLEFVLST